jgi:putative ABC transport system permease protein
MIRFLFKGLIRDRSRSLFPVLTVMAGVMLTVVMYSWIQGTETDMISSNANFNTGHVKIMSRAYAREAEQIPNDLALIDIDKILTHVVEDFPQMVWTPRIRFGGLLDVPDEKGETKSQGPVAGLAIDLLSETNIETEILNLQKALVRGRLPQASHEILVGDQFAKSLDLQINHTATLISATMYGSQTTENFTVVGTIRFGVSAMDRGAIIVDLSGIQTGLDMENAAGEILGFYEDFMYRDKEVENIKNTFNADYSLPDDEFSPQMLSLRDQMGLAQTLEMVDYFSTLLIGIFVFVMSIVLWNAGLMGSLRRYGEIGVRLAIGEDKGHLYRAMIVESVLIGVIGSMIGTTLGVLFSYYLQIHGIDISSMMKNASMLISDVVRAKVTLMSFVIGFIPGLAATILGTSISGIGIYKRQTSQLFKELEA